jgi:1,4-alpha-glucan branching enzyme
MASKTKVDGGTRKQATGPKEKRVQFTIEAPDASSVGVTGTFGAWNDVYPLERQRGGQWKRALDLSPGRYEYLFVVDGEWRATLRTAPASTTLMAGSTPSWKCRDPLIASRRDDRPPD